jgi:hypothetical protein
MRAQYLVCGLQYRLRACTCFRLHNSIFRAFGTHKLALGRNELRPESSVRRIGFFRDAVRVRPAHAKWRLCLSLAMTTAIIPSLIGCVATPLAKTPSTPVLEAALEVTPSSVNFGSAVVGTQNSQTIKLSNDGGAALTVTGVVASGAGISISGFSGSTFLSPGTNSTLTVQATPKSSGAFSGTISILTNVASVGASLPVSGSAASENLSLSVGPTSVSFGTVGAGKTASQNLTVTNTGNAEVTVSKVSLSGPGFSMSGWSSPVTLASSQSLTLDLMFDSATAGNFKGTVTVASDASNSSVAVPLSGTVAAPTPAATHSVQLSWDASSSPVSGYNVYRGGASHGPFTRLNGSLVDALSYKDGTVASGDTYYYVTTAVANSGVESGYSNAAKATIP